MDIYHKIYNYTTTTSFDQNTTLPIGNNYDEKLIFTGQDRLTVDTITDIIIVFLLLFDNYLCVSHIWFNCLL